MTDFEKFDDMSLMLHLLLLFIAFDYDSLYKKKIDFGLSSKLNLETVKFGADQKEELIQGNLGKGTI